jgi:hypothetical protein
VIVRIIMDTSRARRDGDVTAANTSSSYRHCIGGEALFSNENCKDNT